MNIKRIQWAGIVVESEVGTIMIDPLYSGYNKDLFGNTREKFYSLEEFSRPDIIAITHLHSDHFDPQAILSSFGNSVHLVVPINEVENVKKYGFLNVIGLEKDDSYIHKGIEIYACPAVDGLGDNQVSWIIKLDGKTLFHGGDTLWHGYWWKIAKQYGPIDVSFLPVNGAVVRENGMEYSDEPICMEPEQAITAAKLLNTKVIIPIHYGAFHNPIRYSETINIIPRLKDKIKEVSKVKLVILKNNDGIEI